MLTIKQTFYEDELNDFRLYLKDNTWSGAKLRIENMEPIEIDQLLQYLCHLEISLTPTELNDFIWFEWDEIKEEL